MKKGKTSKEEMQDMSNPTNESNLNEDLGSNVQSKKNEKEEKVSEATYNDTKDTKLSELEGQLDKKSRQCEEYLNMLQRMAAEFDNYKKRTAKEKQDLYQDAVCEVIAKFLPVSDNFERALQTAQNNENDSAPLKEGIELVYKQLQDVMKGIGVDELAGAGEKFDPNLHNAVMHVSDDAYDENVVIEVFQRGYIYKEKVIRHSMVKVAN